MANRSPRPGLRLGAHMSIAGGLHRAVERAQQVRATALQVFVKSARQWAAPQLTESQVHEFRESAEHSGLAPYTAAHASYLINLAAADPRIRRRSVRALGVEMDRCARLRIPYLVLHPGSHVGAGEPRGLERVVRGLDRVLAGGRAAPVTLLLENTAGQGTNLGHRFEHLGTILCRAAATERLGVCFDSCHALAAGYEFRDRASFRKTFRQFDETIGIERLRAFHLNDSKNELGSRRDRHEHIGQGRIGLEGFRLILNDPRFRDLPMIIETPKGPDLAEDRRNLATLRALVR